MPLVKKTLEASILNGLKKIMDARSDNAATGDESQDPKEVTAQVAADMASVLADAIDAYIKSGDIYVGPANVTIICTVPGGTAGVTPTLPIHIK